MKLTQVHFATRVGDPANPDGIHKASFAAPAYDIERQADGSVVIASAGRHILVDGIGYWGVLADAPAAAPAHLQAVTGLAGEPTIQPPTRKAQGGRRG